MTITEKIDSITKIGPEYRAVFLPAPKSVKIEITAACNYRCTMCVKSLRNDVGEMDRALYSRIIREMRAAGVEELGVFFVGESFSCKWLAEAIREAKEDVGFPYVFLTTNGSLATPDRVEACMAAGLDSLKFSVNFADDQQFEAVAQVKPRLYHRALENLKAARRVRDEGGYNCGLYASSIAFDGEQGEKMRALVAEHVEPFVDEFYLLPLLPMEGAPKKAGWKPQFGNPGRLGNMRDPAKDGCWSVFTEGHVSSDGALTACCFGNGKDRSLVMADLNEVSFMEGWNSEKYQFLRAAHLAGDVAGTACEGCGE